MHSELSRRSTLGLLAGVPAVMRGAARKPNVLFIVSDDLNNALGCYGHPIIKSPNIDRLAEQGVRFDHSYCQFPLCSPSRTSFLSGLRPDTTHIWGNQTRLRQFKKDIVFLPEYLARAGYFTARVGKVAHDRFEDDVKWNISEDARREGEDTPSFQKPGQPRLVGSLHWKPTDNTDEQEPDGSSARRLVEIIEQHKHQSFFIGAGFHKPHEGWSAPKKYFDLYPPEKIPMPDPHREAPPIAVTDHHNPNIPKEKFQQAIAAYYACISFMDAQVGVLLDALDRMKLTDNTMIMLIGDNGYHLGEHGMWRKMSLYEESARVPLIVATPGKKRGAACGRLIEAVDLCPTILEYCGVPVPKNLEGLSLLPLLDNPNRPWKKGAFTMQPRSRDTIGRSVRTERYRYTEWGNENTAELYDHQTDPRENHNLVEDAKSIDTLTEMRKLLHGGWRAALPKGYRRSA